MKIVLITKGDIMSAPIGPKIHVEQKQQVNVNSHNPKLSNEELMTKINELKAGIIDCKRVQAIYKARGKVSFETNETLSFRKKCLVSYMSELHKNLNGDLGALSDLQNKA